MPNDINQAIASELESMSVDELRRELQKLMDKKEKQRERLNSPEAKAARQQYYQRVKDTPEWKESRQAAAERRRAKEQALKNLIRERAAELGISQDELKQLGV